MSTARSCLDDAAIGELRGRYAAGWSPTALAVAYAVSQRTVYRYVRGHPHEGRQQAMRHRAIGEALERVVRAAPESSSIEVGPGRDGRMVVRVLTRHRTIAWVRSDELVDALERAAARVGEYMAQREAMAS